MQPEENLKNIQQARNAAYQVFAMLEEDELQQKKGLFWRKLAKFFVNSLLLLVLILLLSAMLN